MTTAHILLSGGMDSATLLYQAGQAFGRVEAVSLNYGQKHQKELQYAQKLCAEAGVDHRIIDIKDSIGKGGLSDENMEVPDISYSEIQGVSPTYVPFRNGLLLSTITSLVSAEGEGVVGYGAHAEDAENWAYPDCTPEFIGAMAAAIYIGTYHRFRLYTPLMWLKKWEIAQLGAKLHVPFELTWSCYKGEELNCGVCPTCRARKWAFSDGGVPDPTEYAA